MSSALSVRLQGRAMVAGLAAAGAADAVFKMESAESERLNTRAVCHLVSSSRHGGARAARRGDRCVWSLRRKARNRDPQWAMRAAVMLAECAKKRSMKKALRCTVTCVTDAGYIYGCIYIRPNTRDARATHVIGNYAAHLSSRRTTVVGTETVRSAPLAARYPTVYGSVRGEGRHDVPYHKSVRRKCLLDNRQTDEILPSV